MAIEGFRHKGLRRLAEHDDARGVPKEQAGKIVRILFRAGDCIRCEAS